MKYAQYYKCALQVNPSAYSQYRGKVKMDESEYNTQILNICKEENIRVVGLADHGSVERAKDLRKLLTDNDILVFPGFEISTAEKIHIVCLFSPETDANELNRILGQLGMPEIKNGTEKSNLSCVDIAKKIAENDGFWYAAHITSDNGILKLGQLQHVWTNELLVAAQIPDSEEKIDPNYKNIIKNKEPQYKRKNVVAYINAKDICDPMDLKLETATSLIKMSELNFDSFKSAFTDPTSRIKLNSSIKTTYKSYISQICVKGGYLDGLELYFSYELNTIIGGRGTGKSTLITFIRYVLGNYSYDKELEKEIEDMIKNNLGTSGEINIYLSSYSLNGQKYKLVKRYNQNTIVFNEDGSLSELTVTELLPKIEIYGQNELIDAIKSSETITNIVKRLIKIDENILKEKKMFYKELKDNTQKIISINEEINKLGEELGALPKIIERLSKYNEIGFEEKLKPIVELEKENSYIESLISNISSYKTDVEKINFIADQSSDSTEFYIEMKNQVKAFNDKLLKYEENIKNEFKNLIVDSNRIKEMWIEHKNNKESEFSKLISQIEDIQDKSNIEVVEDYRNLVSIVENSRPNKEKEEILLSKKKELLEKRKSILEKCKEANSKYSRDLEKKVAKINKNKFDNKIKVIAYPIQNKEKLLTKLKKIEGIGDKSITGISEFEGFDCITFVENMTKKPDELSEIYSITKNTSSKILTMEENSLYEIEEMQLDDITEIALNVNGNFKNMRNLSKGQQCTALLNILLVENTDPLIIDQPEDNLDNSFIAESFVDSIRKFKSDRQYIFATHNANIPVFGDAELIVTLTEEDGKGKVIESGIGSIDSKNVKQHVIKLLEGGKEAFEIREKKYKV
ncbi:TrlF family AAA-like ATPase [Campylobacter ureolyticus]|uniref:TrlF family AAA-like ATPase n=1 Tax=Campylobacter ureolyticus TaxID=827 RepID=UPI0004ADE790|nr:AAA family ATPase [Campylobacter ureolyticus]